MITRNFIRELNIKEYEVITNENEEEYYDKTIQVKPYIVKL